MYQSILVFTKPLTTFYCNLNNIMKPKVIAKNTIGPTCNISFLKIYFCKKVLSLKNGIRLT